MTFSVLDGRFALFGSAEWDAATARSALERSPSQVIREDDGMTILVLERDLAPLLSRHPNATVERDLAWIRFDAPMGWEVVGFLARVTEALAHVGVPVGAICGFRRDHLFISARYLPTARAALARLFPERPARDPNRRTP